MALLAGMAHIKIDGANYSTDGEFDIKIQNVKFETVVDADGGIHHIETKQPSSISGSLYLTQDLSPDKITGATAVTIQVELKSGKTALLSQAVYVGDAAVSSKDGTFEISFEGVGKWV